MQTAVNALNSPSVGWVMTIFCSGRISPPPTGTSEVAASSVPASGVGAVVAAAVVGAAAREGHGGAQGTQALERDPATDPGGFHVISIRTAVVIREARQ